MKKLRNIKWALPAVAALSCCALVPEKAVAQQTSEAAASEQLLLNHSRMHILRATERAILAKSRPARIGRRPLDEPVCGCRGEHGPHHALKALCRR